MADGLAGVSLTKLREKPVSQRKAASLLSAFIRKQEKNRESDVKGNYMGSTSVNDDLMGQLILLKQSLESEK
eukprot:CAMPEP_0197525764 /NCGR_PEP_ID=MMETSP1318-20131121/14310_1 /TAXON_ID=552666 /ORGANISM="Partenskyella glossopodia, Strain RCC365" /LENGTH=71 /DNA_ID=CAMNT_0043079487 /DNA_START=3 /DNA_END=218 /DNA_ORIENTATION=-